MSFTIDRLGRHSDAAPATTRADTVKIAEHRLRNTAFLIARSRFLDEVDKSVRTGLDGDAA